MDVQVRAADQGGNTDAASRRYAGSAGTMETPQDYTVLLPTDHAWSDADIARACVADALQRNGKVVDEDTLEAVVGWAQGNAQALGVPGLAAGQAVWKLQQGESRADGRATAPFEGYALALPASAQQALLDQVGQVRTQQDLAGPEPVAAKIQSLSEAANSADRPDVVQVLQAIDTAIKAGQASSAAGDAPDKVALNTVLQFATGIGHEKDAAKILAAYSAVKGVSSEVGKVGEDAHRVFNGQDPKTKKALTFGERVDSAFDLLTNGFKLAENIGTAARAFGIGGAFASSLIGIAPIGIAIVAFAQGIYGLIKKARESILGPQWDEFRARFPGAQDQEPKGFIKGALAQIAGMPDAGGNAQSTTSRILDMLGGNSETRERFLAVLKRSVAPPELVDAMAKGDALTAEQWQQLAKASKGSAKSFLELELDDTKRYVKDSDGDRTRGTYLLEGERKAIAERNTNKVGGAIDEGLRIGGVLSGTALAFDGLLKDMLGKVRGTDATKALSSEQQGNVAGAVAAASQAGGLTKVDALLASQDGTRLFAVQGDPRSELRQVVSVDLQAAARQPLEVSRQLVASQAASDAAQSQERMAALAR